MKAAAAYIGIVAVTSSLFFFLPQVDLADQPAFL